MDARYSGGGSPRRSAAASAAGRHSTLVRRAALAFATLAVASLALAARADAFVYWANISLDAIGRANLDGTGANQRFITGAAIPHGVAVDDEHIHWANGRSGTIGRS